MDWRYWPADIRHDLEERHCISITSSMSLEGREGLDNSNTRLISEIPILHNK